MRQVWRTTGDLQSQFLYEFLDIFVGGILQSSCSAE